MWSQQCCRRLASRTPSNTSRISLTSPHQQQQQQQQQRLSTVFASQPHRSYKIIPPAITQPLPVPKQTLSPWPLDLSNPNRVRHIPLIRKAPRLIADHNANKDATQPAYQELPEITKPDFDWSTCNDPAIAESAIGFEPTLLRPFPWIRTEQPKITAGTMTDKSLRTGLIALKCGMLQMYDANGVRFAVTVLRVDSQVVAHRMVLSKNGGYLGLQLGCGRHKLKKLLKSELTHFKKAGVYPKQHLHEFKVTPDALLPVGFTLNAAHFSAGQLIDVQGTTVGKGHQGAMVRHNFGGMPASHGVSLTHRALGSTGAAQDPGKVFRGKKMSGHMGAQNCTQHNLRIYRIDPQRNLIFVRGAVPGGRDNYVYVKDAVKIRRPKKDEEDEDFEAALLKIPFPTCVIDQAEPEFEADKLIEKQPEIDPFAFGTT